MNYLFCMHFYIAINFFSSKAVCVMVDYNALKWNNINMVSRDVHETFWAKTETFKILSETRHCSFRDAGRDLEAPETLESLGSFNISPRCFRWRMVKHIANENKIIHIN